MRLVRTLAYWLGALLLASLPVFWLPTKGYNDISFLALSKTTSVAYRDLAVLIQAILGVAIFDAFETARLNARDGVKVLFVMIVLIILVLDFSACSISYGLAAGSTINSQLPSWFFLQSVAFSFLAKTFAALSEMDKT